MDTNPSPEQHFFPKICSVNKNYVVQYMYYFHWIFLGRRRNLKKRTKHKTKKMVTPTPKELSREQLKIIPWQGV